MTSSQFCKNKEKKQKLHLLFNCLQLILLPKRQLTKRYASFNRVFPLMQISIGSVIIILMGIHEIGVICTSSYVFRFVVPQTLSYCGHKCCQLFDVFDEIYYIFNVMVCSARLDLDTL